jgi:integrase
MLNSNIKPARKSKSRLNAVKVDSKKNVIPKGDSRKPRWWRVNVGKRFTGTAKQRRFFDTEADANDFIRQTEDAARKRGKSAFDIPQALAVEAMELSKELEQHGASLTEAVRFYLRNGPLISKKTLSDLIPIYLLTKKEDSYRRAQQISMKVFERDFGKKPVASIMAPAIEAWFEEKAWNDLNKRNYMRDLSMFFRWAEQKDHCPGNPFDKITRPDVKLKEPEIFTVEETRRLLEAATLQPELGLLPMYAVGLFSGVRIEELEKVRWEMFDWEESVIRMPAAITKTEKPRRPEIMPALLAALEEVKRDNGLIVSPVNLRKRRAALLAFAGVEKKRNGLRHSFSSYHAAKYEDPGKLQLLLGQKTASVLWDHYLTATSKRHAEKYFNLRPPFLLPKEETADAPLS